MKDRLHFNLRGLKFWMTAAVLFETEAFLNQQSWYCWVTVQYPHFLPAMWPIVMDFLTLQRFYALFVKFDFPVLDTRPCPFTTGHTNAGNNQGQLGLYLTPHICKAFHGPGCPRTTTFLQHEQMEGLVIHLRYRRKSGCVSGKQWTTSSAI